MTLGSGDVTLMGCYLNSTTIDDDEWSCCFTQLDRQYVYVLAELVSIQTKKEEI